MKAIKYNRVLEQDGSLLLENIPACRGENVEIILLLKNNQVKKDKLLSLAGIISSEEADDMISIIKEGKTFSDREVKL